MHVFSKSAWREVVQKDHTLEGPISEWYKIAKAAEWQNLVDVRRVYPHADYVEPYTVFNLRGNKYRLIVKIEYRRQMIFVKHLLTHEEYDRGGEKMNALAVAYAELLSETRPEVIRAEKQNQEYIARLEELTSKQNVTAAEDKLIQLLTVLVEKFEDSHYPVPNAGPLDIIRHLMEVHQLRQKDLVDVFGTESVVSDVLNGKRELTKEHIRRLSERFGVSPAVFF